MAKSQKGYSLVEIGVGVLILTVFLICSVALFNGCYNTYRMIQQRNIAVNYAVSAMEDMLQTDADVLTGFFIEEIDEVTNQYKLVPHTDFYDYVVNNFNTRFIERYVRLNFGNATDVSEISKVECEKYIYADRNYLVADYIKNVVENMSEEEYNSEAVRNGEYAFLTSNVTYEGTQITLDSGDVLNSVTLFPIIATSGDQVIILDNENNMIVKKTVTRLPFSKDSEAFGNQVLKLKVEVFFTNRINNEGATEKDLKSITIDSVKVANNS